MMETERDWDDGLADRIVALPFIVEPMGFVVATPEDPRALVIEAVGRSDMEPSSSEIFSRKLVIFLREGRYSC